ncbi:hypothetical protein FF38_12038 [Lucilia cuprina]|uniref:Uncharacterized protein n=1 Tax=Lucilia cuprina TaxID=7375 RepID=A0A0L0BM25_LUCCU|nr:hypothetical protein FF38_12038 [Lucilia cuprina]
MSKKINRKFMPKFIKCKIIDKIGNNLYGVEDMKEYIKIIERQWILSSLVEIYSRICFVTIIYNKSWSRNFPRPTTFFGPPSLKPTPQHVVEDSHMNRKVSTWILNF